MAQHEGAINEKKTSEPSLFALICFPGRDTSTADNAQKVRKCEKMLIGRDSRGTKTEQSAK